MNSVVEDKSNVQNPDSISQEKIKKLVEDACKKAMGECFKGFEQKYASKSEKVSFWKKINYIFAYLAIVASLIAGFINWNKEIITAQIAEIQAQKNEKINLQKEFNKAVLDTRILVLNQNSFCEIKKNSSVILKIDRVSSLKHIVTLNTTINNIFGFQAYELTANLVEKIYGIKNVCDLHGDDYDHQLQDLYKKIGNIMNLSIKKDADKINSLIIKRHGFEFNFKI